MHNETVWHKLKVNIGIQYWKSVLKKILQGLNCQLVLEDKDFPRELHNTGQRVELNYQDKFCRWWERRPHSGRQSHRQRWHIRVHSLRCSRHTRRYLQIIPAFIKPSHADERGGSFAFTRVCLWDCDMCLSVSDGQKLTKKLITD